MPLSIGDSFTVDRSFTKSDVERFIDISGDKNSHHVVPDENGRLVVHGLLTATLPTIIGGQLNLVAKEITLDFIEPVYTGDQIKCNVIVAELEERAYGVKVRAEFICTNHYSSPVLKGHVFGIIRKNDY